ncbi:YhgE/Pip family protein, partial [Deinococcus sp.]|uniref:YhgE/Pip family protein n=1 Tax=Deinococcus sp. TaxID=47478 RepID=UPI0025C05826
ATTLSSKLKEAQQGSAAAVTGTKKLADGATKLAAGTAQLQTGSATLASKLKEAQQGSAAAVTGTQKLADGATKLAAGTAQLQTGSATLAARTAQAATGARTLGNGAKSLQSGVDQLAAGNLKIKGALGTITSQLPAQSDLTRLGSGAKTLAEKSRELSSGLTTLADGAEKLRSGAGELNDGAARLHSGLSTLYTKIPASVEQLGGDPQGLSASVRPVTEVFAPAGTNGVAFSPYFMALSLWVGVTLTTFIFPYQQLPLSGRRTSQFARMLRKAAVPALLVVVQALLVVLAVHLLGVNYLHPLEVVATSILSSLSFLTLVLGLIFCFGAAGRLIALILLVLQLAASGGSYPVETSPHGFQLIHNWVPVTQAVNALRHAITGAYQGDYVKFMFLLALMGLSGLGLGLLGRRRWELVKDEDFKPLVSSPVVSAFEHQEVPNE